ncbi:MAG: ABC transporter permease subunit [Polyangiaceae bacterium]|nr:ABC transporter permease subunit [Polyangiaceae bacterium]MBK8936797.1 ABC transporter permease subunit [Polyangiaceae bacterium]
MKKRVVVYVVVHAILLFASAVVLYPVLWVVRLAVSPSGRLTEAGALPIPREVSLESFESFVFAEDFYGRPIFFIQLGNSLLVSGAATIVGLIFALSAAYGFSRFAFPLKNVGMRTMLVSQMFPAVVTAVPLLFLLDVLGLFGTTAGLVLIYATTSVPFSIWMLKGYFDVIPRDLDESARLDGASSWIIFTRILLPLVRPGIGLTALFSFMSAYNEFIMASVFLDDVTRYTLPVTLQQSVGGFDPSWGLFAAGSLLLSLPVVAVFFFVQRQMVEGMTAGAVKG